MIEQAETTSRSIFFPSVCLYIGVLLVYLVLSHKTEVCERSIVHVVIDQIAPVFY
jgi:hypothetical protein